MFFVYTTHISVRVIIFVSQQWHFGIETSESTFHCEMLRDCVGFLYDALITIEIDTVTESTPSMLKYFNVLIHMEKFRRNTIMYIQNTSWYPQE